MIEPLNVTQVRGDQTQPRADLTSGWASSPAEDVAERVALLPATDRYEVGEEIARGGMGAVHRCYDRLLGRELAVKVLLPRHEDKPHLLRRFVEEAQVGGRLQHPGIVPVHEIGRLPDGRVFFTMKLVEGETLGAVLARRAHPSDDLSAHVKVFEQICQTLGYAHSRRVIHRDLKPANIMVGAFGEVQVMDWGIAKVLTAPNSDTEAPAPRSGAETAVASGTDASAARDDVTAAGTVLGTYAYMPPEQASGHAAQTDERGDVFGLGAILCEILTGVPPYSGPTAHDTRTLALAADLGPALARLDRCGADPELVALCKRCLAVDPTTRPADGGAVATAITGYLAGVAERLKTAEVESAAAAARARAERGKRRVLVFLAATVFLATFAGVGTWAWIEKQRRDRAAQTAQAVNQALGEARAAQKEADSGRYESLDDWRTAESLYAKSLTAADQASQTLTAGEPNSALRAELDELLPALRNSLEAAQRNRKMLERLAGIESLPHVALNDDDFDDALTDANNEDKFLSGNRRRQFEHAQAFREFGIDVVNLPPSEAAQALDREALRPALVNALTQLLTITDNATQRERLETLVLLVERDPFRRRVLESTRKADRAELLALAREDATLKLPLALLLRLTTAMFDKEEIPEAVSLLRRAQTARPGEFGLNNDLGTYLMYTGSRTPVRVAEATRYFTAALVISPTSHTARVNLGDALNFLGAYEEALETYRLARVARPDIVFGRTKLAIALAISGYHDEAMTESRIARDSRPGSAWVQEAHGSVCSMVGRHDEAVKAFRQAIALNPKMSAYHGSLGQALTELGQHDEAVAEQRESVRLKASGTTWARLADALLHRNGPGDLSTARAAAREAVRLQPGSASALLAQANVYENEGRRELALEKMREAIRAAPHDTGVWWQLGVLLRRAHQFDEAVHILQEAVRRAPLVGPRRASLLIDLGRVQALRNDSHAAESTYREAMQLRAGTTAATELIDLLVKQNRLDDAASVAESTLKTDPQGTTRLKLIEIRQKQKRYANAIALCTDPAVAELPPFRRCHAQLLLDDNQADEAFTIIRPLTRNREDNLDAAAWQIRARILVKLDRLDEAAQAYSLLLSAKPSRDFSFVEVSMEYAEILFQQHRNGNGVDEDGQAQLLGRAHSYRGWALKAADRPIRAIAEWRAAATASPEEARYHRGLAEALLAASRPNEAKTAIESALKLKPRDPANLDVLAKCLLAVDDGAGACEVYRKAVAAEGGARYAFAYGQCLLREARFQEARELFGKTKDSAGVARCDTLLALEAKAGEFASGKSLPDPEQLLDLAELHAARGRPAAAARWFRKAIRDRRLIDTDPQWARAVAAAAGAACGHGDGVALTPAERAEWHRQAREWIRGELNRIATQLPNAEKASDNLAVLSQLRFAGSLECVRTTDKLPTAEQVQWRQVWFEVDALQTLVARKAEGKEAEGPVK